MNYRFGPIKNWKHLNAVKAHLSGTFPAITIMEADPAENCPVYILYYKDINQFEYEYKTDSMHRRFPGSPSSKVHFETVNMNFLLPAKKPFLVYEGQIYITHPRSGIDGAKLIYKNTHAFHADIIEKNVHPDIERISYINWIQPGTEPADFEFPDRCIIFCMYNDGGYKVCAPTQLPKNFWNPIEMYFIIPHLDYKYIS